MALAFIVADAAIIYPGLVSPTLVHSSRIGPNFAYTINGAAPLPYLPHGLLPYAPFVPAAEVKEVKEAAEIKTLPLATPYGLYPGAYPYGLYPYNVAPWAYPAGVVPLADQPAETKPVEPAAADKPKEESVVVEAA